MTRTEIPRPVRYSPEATERRQRDRRIQQLHDYGWSERKIAREVGVSRTTVWTVLQAAKAAR